MTTDEFVRHLQRVSDHFDEWTLVLDSGPVAERRSKPRYKLRATIHQDGSLLLFDPIGAVCFAQTGKIFPPEDWQFAGETLGLSSTAGAEITWSSNDQTWAEDHGQRKPVDRLQRLRIRLFKAVDLDIEIQEPELVSKARA